MSESLRNDGRIWVPKSKEVAEKLRKKQMSPNDVAEDDRDYYLERKYPSFGNLAPRDISSRAAKEACDDGRGVAPTGLGVYLDFRDATKRLGENVIRSRYGNLFQMYEKIAGEDPYKGPMMIYPAVHYTMGGLWVDYNLMSNIPGLHVLGEANFSDHGANRLGASALMQGLADGYFVIPTTIANYLVTQKPGTVTTDAPEFKQVEAETKERVSKMFSIQGKRTRQDHVGRVRHGTVARRPDQGLASHPANPRGILEQRPHPRFRRQRQHGTRKGRPCRRLPRIRRSHVLRRA
jgi:succinate dehydrogenase / fumarate reductase flavoprotein subunit